MKLKKGANVENLHPQVWYALGVAEAIYADLQRELIVTAGTDGTHMVGSCHYEGLAADIRTRHLSPYDKGQAFRRIQTVLDKKGFDVVQHFGTYEHIHIEFDPHTGDQQWEERVD